MKRNILIIGPCLTMGGMERASVNLSNALVKKGQIVGYFSIFRRERFLILDHHVKFFEPPAGINENRINILRTFILIRNAVKSFDWDAILVFNKFYGAITAFSMIFLKTHLYISERSSPLYKWSLPIRIFNRAAYFLKPPDKVIAQTEIAAKYQRKYYGRKSEVIVIPNALREIELFPGVIRQKQILAVGRLDDYLKGMDRLLEAYAKLKCKDWNLVLAGSEENINNLRAQARKLEISDRITFTGKVKNIDLLYAKSGIFVIPSRSEGFPNALCEAMAAGLPCISFNFIAGSEEIITDGYDGILVPDGDIEGLTEKIQYLIDNEIERNRLGLNAMKIANRLSPDIIADKFIKIIQE